jgi:hypothetical protein
MTQKRLTILEIDWTEAIGPTMAVGSPYLFGWLRALFVESSSIGDGRVAVVTRAEQSADWAQHSGPVTQLEAEVLQRALTDLGIPDRAPRVELVPDSSDTLSTSTVRIAVGERRQTFVVQTQCSGFRGPDADGLRAVFQRILSLTGYSKQRTMFCGKGDPGNE